MSEHPLHKAVLGPTGEVLPIPENKAIIETLNSLPHLNPRELLHLASVYKHHEATQSLAAHLTSIAISAIARERSVRQAMESIKNHPVPWSFFGDLWNSIVRAVEGSSSPPTNYTDPEAQPGGKQQCVTACFLFVLMEQCLQSDGNYGPWKPIGVCFIF